MQRITDDHIAHWKDHGYVVIEGFLTDDELAAARANIHMLMPTAEEYTEAPERHRRVAGGGLMFDSFPFPGDTLNNICTDPALISFAEEQLGTQDVALSHSQLIGKYAGAGEYDQLMHVDYGNNTLAYPKDDEHIRDIPMILYYSDVTEEFGPTCVVSQQHTPSRLLQLRELPRAEYPDLYDIEQRVTVPAGSILIYSMRTWHRGSTFRATFGARFTHHMGYRAGAYRWLGQSAFQHDGGRPEMDRFLQQATPRQREVVGFPPAGHPYWDEETLAGVAARYPEMDMAPYASAAR